MTVTATLLASGAPVDDALVIFTIATPDNNVTEQPADTDSNGNASVSFVGTQAGLYIVSASYGGSPSLDEATPVLFPVFFAQQFQMGLAPGSQTVAAGTATVVVVTLAQTPQGTPQADAPVSVEVVSGPDAGEVVTGRTNTAGVASIVISNGQGAGTDTVQAMYSDGVTTTTSNTVSITWVAQSQSITFTSSPPPDPTVGGSYAVSATGGGSGIAVTFSVDSSSTAGACTVSG